VALGGILFLPGLKSFGFWDPYEIRVADAARALAQAPDWTWGPQLGRPPAVIWLVALGFKYLGVGELGGRLPIALIALAGVLATYYAGAALVGRRGAFIGALALACSPGFLFGGRQLTSNAPLVLGAALAVGGLARAAWPATGTSTIGRALDLVLGLVGLLVGHAAGATLVGVAAPIAAVTCALFAAGCAPRLALAGAAATVGSLVSVGLALSSKSYSSVLGAMPRPLNSQVVVTQHLKELGFSLFPWIALLPMAGIRALDAPEADGADANDRARARFGGVALVAWFALTYLAGTFQSMAALDVALPVAPAVMLLVGGYLDQRLEAAQLAPLAGLTAALGAIILGRDFFLFPETYVGVHVSESIRWPGPLTTVPYVIMAFAAFWGGVVGLGLGAPLASPRATADKAASQTRQGRALLVGGALLASVAMALVSTHWIIPEVSKHLSARDLYGKTKQLDPNAPVGQYRFNASGASYYAGGKTPITLMSLQDLFNFLGRQERVFVMAGSDELASIDQQARQSRAAYYVLDDSNSRYLVLSNRLGPQEQDLNPLKRFISETPPKPQFPVEADFEGKVQLIGYDLPQELSRGQEFKIRLYFKVLQPLGNSYKVFIHFDGPGTRFNGDHIPMEGRFPTQHWVPGYYITDEHLMTPDRAVQPSGYYRVFMGFFLGDTRLKVTSGQQDGENRVKLGGVPIK
jgi:hypothetical protein